MKSLYNYPRAMVLLLLFIVAAGAGAVSNMPRLEDPHMRNRVAFIITRFPGASAERVEALISEKIEKKLREVSELKDISSTSRPGLSFIVAEMKDEVTATQEVASRMRDKIQEITDLPDGASEPIFDDDRLYAFTGIIGLKWHAQGMPNYAILGRHAEELDTRLRNVTDTDFVRTFGLPAEEIAVTLDEDMLSALGLSAQDVAEKIFAGDPKSSSGFLSGAANRYVIEVAGALDSLERIREIPLAASEATGIVKIGDVARVERTHREPPDSLAYLSGDYGVVVAARMLESGRVDGWMADVRSVLEDFNTNLPENIEAEVIFDQAGYMEQRLSDLMANLIYAAVIVLAVLLVTLGWRASAIAGSILPLAALSALAILNLLGYQIQQMVVAGMIVALGMMVDNAIVITDEVQSRLLRGEPRGRAVARTVKKLWLPLLGSTITTVIAFMPIILMPGNAGEFVGGISAAVIAALISSYVISFAIISALAGRVLGKRRHKRRDAILSAQRRRWWREGIEVKAVSGRFERALRWTMKNPRKTMAIVGSVPLLGFALALTLTEQFFPNADRDQFHIELDLPAQASIAETRRTVEAVHDYVIADPDVLAADWYIGQSAAKFYYNLLTDRDGAANYAQGMITATDAAAVDRLVEAFQAELDHRYPEIQTLVRKLEQGPPYDAPVVIRIYGPDLETLRDLGEQVRAELMAVPSIVHANATLSVGRPEIVVNTDDSALASLGLDPRAVSSQLRTAVDGSIAGAVIEETEEVPVRVRTAAADRSSLYGLRSIELVPRTGGREADDSFSGVPLTAVAEVGIEASVGTIPRRNGERVNSIQGFTRHDVLPEVAFAQVSERLSQAQFQVPPGYHIDFGGESEKRNEAVGNLLAQAGILAVLMILAIVLTFNSFRLAGVTFASAVQAAGLGLFCLWVFQYPLGFVVIVGLMGLVGLAINAAIVILSELKGDPAAAAGEDEAIVQGVMSTGRHIFSTTMTTFGGFMPLALSGSTFWTPFAVAIAGGTLLTMFVSFFFAPAAFKVLVSRRPLAQIEAAPLGPQPVPRQDETPVRAAE